MLGWIKQPAPGAVDSGLIPNLVKPMTYELAFTASLFEAQRLSINGTV